VRQLQRDLKEAQADVSEVQQLAAAFEQSKAANAKMRAELEAVQLEVASLREAGSSSMQNAEELKAARQEADQLQVRCCLGGVSP